MVVFPCQLPILQLQHDVGPVLQFDTVAYKVSCTAVALSGCWSSPLTFTAVSDKCKDQAYSQSKRLFIKVAYTSLISL